MSDNLEPDYEAVKRRLEAEEQALRVEKLRRELREKEETESRRAATREAVKEGAATVGTAVVVVAGFAAVALLGLIAFIWLYRDPDAGQFYWEKKATGFLALLALAFIFSKLRQD